MFGKSGLVGSGLIGPAMHLHNDSNIGIDVGTHSGKRLAVEGSKVLAKERSSSGLGMARDWSSRLHCRMCDLLSFLFDNKALSCFRYELVLRWMKAAASLKCCFMMKG